MKNAGIVTEKEIYGRLQKWQSENKDTDIQQQGWVKVGFVEGNIHEHLFVKVIMVNDQETFIGEVDNDPVFLTNVSSGDFVVLGRDLIEDYVPPVDFKTN